MPDARQAVLNSTDESSKKRFSLNQRGQAEASRAYARRLLEEGLLLHLPKEGWDWHSAFSLCRKHTHPENLQCSCGEMLLEAGEEQTAHDDFAHAGLGSDNG
mmetsp:Transcript_48444/g.85402  ORF Transcript_48444/g.85402 Transcript_48444/m.85402 type:complete len:102 (-) Transcript_48444:1471-1776(-)